MKEGANLAPFFPLPPYDYDDCSYLSSRRRTPWWQWAQPFRRRQRAHISVPGCFGAAQRQPFAKDADNRRWATAIVVAVRVFFRFVFRLWIGLLSIGLGVVLLGGCGSGESGSVNVTRTADTPSPAASLASLAATTPTAPSPTDGGPSSGGCKSAIAWNEALDHVGEQATVRGPVKGATYANRTKGKPTFIDLGRAYPDPAAFTVLIWGDDRARFSIAPEKAYTGKTICVTGLITSYKGGAEIEVSSPSEIVVD